MLLHLSSRTQRRLRQLLQNMLHRWRRILFFLSVAWALMLYARHKHPFLERAHEITSHDIDFEISHPPDNIETNAFLDLAAAWALCSAHRFPIYRARQSRRKIYDLIMMNGEMDWLEIRLDAMAEHVDYFVVVESPVTFTGLERELVLRREENWERVKRWEKKIVYHVLENMPEKEGRRTWDLEDFQRNAMLQALEGLEEPKKPRWGDVIVVADVDEVVRPAALLVLRNCETPRRMTLRSQFFYYGFQWQHRGEEWAHPQATVYQGAATILPSDLRNGEGGNPLLAWWDRADLWNAGWHCSTCFQTAEEVLNKMASFSHTGLNQEVFRDKIRMVDRVRKGKDLWDREGEVYDRVDDHWDIPELVKKEPARFAYLLDRDGSNAGFVDMGTGESAGD